MLRLLETHAYNLQGCALPTIATHGIMLHTQGPRPLNNDLLFGDYEVSYVSTAKAKEQQGQRKLSLC